VPFIWNCYIPVTAQARPRKRFKATNFQLTGRAQYSFNTGLAS